MDAWDRKVMQLKIRVNGKPVPSLVNFRSGNRSCERALQDVGVLEQDQNNLVMFGIYILVLKPS
ncbi:hypothetical protein PAXRUDRAFT_644211 [Paxillus rubicundulus Ve08.2h10]|uniref:Uncharacterized protein n=1 Tax=Paxillus rubicundulus Ve08.2h10 TaxID=930991 RepID=A0A0D0DJ93_9AGAM|nr:hypothetical protein PAXRUDRAFT_644211 [Paxillus rubicundulus Ve08.2h10]